MPKSRKLWLDIVRATAIICVVLCHSTEAVYRPVLLGQTHISFLLWNIENLLFTIGRIGVPLFLATTGALLLPRHFSDITAFYKKSLLPLLFTTEIWIFIYYFFTCFINHKSINLIELLMEMLFLKAPSLSHMWYMPVILGCYVAIPFVSHIFHSINNLRQYTLLYSLGIIIFFVVPTINVFLNEAITAIPKLNVQIDTGLWGSCFSFYIITGYLISNHEILKKLRTHLLISAIIIAFALNSVGQYYLYSHQYYNSTWLYWYTDFPIFLIGISTFELIRRIFHQKDALKFESIINYISRCSFGVYIIHKPILVILQKYFSHFPVRYQLPFLFFAGLLGSFIIVYPFKHILKKAGSILFHIK